MIMKLKGFIFTAVVAIMAFAACQKTENLGLPDLRLSAEELTFGQDAGAQTIKIKATRDWTAEIPKDVNWVVLDPESGLVSSSEQEVTLSVLANDGMDRSASIKFTIGMKSRYLKVNQAGPSGSADDLIVYLNDFDITKAQNSGGWPYLDSNYNLWDNKKGTGASTVEYAFGGKVSVRTSGKLSNDGSGFSHYNGSGVNKIFFGAATSILKIQNITLPESGTTYKLSFGGQKYLQDSDSNFSFDECKVYLSNDSQKWTPVTMAFPENSDLDGDWNLASASFTVPAGTSTLGIAFVVTASSAYSIDDVLLEIGTEAGQTIDFSAGTEISGTTAGNPGSGDSTSAPESKGKKTVAEFIAAADTQNYYELTGTVSRFSSQYCSFDLTDATGAIYVYSVLSESKSEWASKIANGGTITIYGKYEYYAQKSQHEVVDAYIVSYTSGSGGGEVTPPSGDETVTSIADVLAAQGALASGTTIEGVVVSNMDLNNLTSKKSMYVQDGTAALQFYLAENHSFAFGDKVRINLSGVSVGEYNGAKQISGLALGNVTKVSSGNAVTPKTVSVTDFLANKYEGQYVAIEGVQVASSDLSKTFVMDGAHTSINMETADGKTFVIFSSKYASYGASAVPQGSGTIKGISSVSNGVMQIIFAQGSDYAGLTGARFDGTEVTPPSGGGEEGGGDPVTPPSGESTVAKLVMNTLGLANATSVDGKEIKVDENITLVFRKGSASTAPAYYDASQGIRMYQNGATLDVKAASGKTISSIKFTFDYKQWYIAPDSGSLSAEGDVRTWTGSANTVKFTSTGTDKNHRAYVKAIEVTYL